LAHWLEQLEEYDFNVIHCRGYGNMDALSRVPFCHDSETETDDIACAGSFVTSSFLLPNYSPQKLRSHQLEDGLIGPMLKAKETREKSQIKKGDRKWFKLVQLWNKLVVGDGILW